MLPHPKRRPPAAFTIVELLVVVGILFVLIAILLPTVARSRELAMRASCLSNERQLTQAWLVYAGQNEGRMVSSFTRPGAWVDAKNTLAGITAGLLYPLVRDVNAYRCPADSNLLLARSYSINCMLDGENWGNKPWTRLTQIADAARTFVFIEEFDPRGYNQNSFALYPSGPRWVDMPGAYHGMSTLAARGGSGTCLSFADGHAEYWQWRDNRTLAIAKFFANTPGDPDLAHLQAAKLGK